MNQYQGQSSLKEVIYQPLGFTQKNSIPKPRKSESQKFYLKHQIEQKKFFRDRETRETMQDEIEVQAENRIDDNSQTNSHINENNNLYNEDDQKYQQKRERTNRFFKQEIKPLSIEQNKLPYLRPHGSHGLKEEIGQAFSSFIQKKNQKQFLSGGFMPYVGKNFKEQQQFLQSVLQNKDQYSQPQKVKRNKSNPHSDFTQKKDKDQEKFEKSSKEQQESNFYAYDFQEIPLKQENNQLNAQTLENTFKETQKNHSSSARLKEEEDKDEFPVVQNKNAMEYLQRFVKQKLDPDWKKDNLQIKQIDVNFKEQQKKLNVIDFRPQISLKPKIFKKEKKPVIKEEFQMKSPKPPKIKKIIKRKKSVGKIAKQQIQEAPQIIDVEQKKEEIINQEPVLVPEIEEKPKEEYQEQKIQETTKIEKQKPEQIEEEIITISKPAKINKVQERKENYYLLIENV